MTLGRVLKQRVVEALRKSKALLGDEVRDISVLEQLRPVTRGGARGAFASPYRLQRSAF